MTTIHIPASREYDVLAGEGLLAQSGPLIRSQAGGRAAFLVSDDHVFPLYGQRVLQSLELAGFRVKSHVIPHGEASKSLGAYGALLAALSESHMTRSDVLIALGGGVVGDLTGFAAATYQRGIPFVQIPTTLLAMVDSSVGGKTAVNLPSGKNQVGCFYQPHLVLCDTQTLSTLPEDEFLCGCAEVIKYAILGDTNFFDRLQRTPVHQQLEDVITTCVSMKRDLVVEDEFDRGARMLLNFGHTVGHAVETCSGFRLLHGQAVAIGMAVITRAACAKGICTQETEARVLSILEQFGLPTQAPYDLDRLSAAALTDKKIDGESLRLILPQRIGHCCVETIPAADIRDWMRAGGVL